MKADKQIQETLPEAPSFRKIGEIPRMQPTAMTEGQLLGESLTKRTDFQELTTDKFTGKKTGLQKQIENAENAFRAYQGDELANQVQSYIPPEETLKIKQELGFDEKMSNVGSNFVNRLERFAPNTALAVGQTLTTLLGEDYGGEAYRMITGGVGNAEFHRMEAFDKLAKLDAEYKYSKGLIQSVQDLDLGGVAAGITDAVGSLVSTIITSAPTAGLGLYSDMVGSGLYDYNSAKANRLGITVDELYDSSQNEFFVPAILGGLGAQLEKIGLKGIKTAIMSNMAKGAGQKFALIGHNMNKEGVTELLQTGLEEVSNTLAQGKSVAEATLEFGKTLFSKKGAESYLMGVVASGSAIGGGRILKGLFSDKSKKKASQAIQAIEQQQQELSNPDLTEESRVFVWENIKNNVAELVDAVDSDVNETDGLSEDQKREVNNLNTKIQAFEVVINDPAASEETKNRAAKVSKETQAKIDAIIKKKPPIVPPATGGAMVEAEPIAKPTFDTEEQLIEEGKTAEEEYKKTGDQVTYEQKIKELEEREKNLVPAPEDAEIGKPEEVVEVEPIRQLGTGANVYFETEKYRVNDGLKKGNVLLNIQSKTSEAPIANIEFDNANDAVIIAQELNNKFPDGVPDAILIDKYIEQLKNDLLKPQEDAIQEQGLQKPIKSTTFVNEEIKPNIISEGSQKESRVDSKTVRNFKEKDTVERNNSSIQTWLESISRNDKKEKRNEGEELFGESVFSKESQAGVLLDDIYRKWQSLRAQTLDESKVGQDIGTTRTRTSLEQQRVGQQNRELAIIDELRAQETSQQDSEQGNISENSRKKQVEAGRMVEKILELSSLPNDPKKASVARALRDLLSSSTQKEKELIINEIKNKLYAVSQSISSKVPVLTEATVGEEVEQGKPEPEAEVVTEEGAKAEEVGSGVDVASKILDLLSKSDEKGVNRIKRRSEVSGISLIEAAKEYLENFQSLSGTGKNRFEELQIQASEQTKPQQLKAEKPIVSKEAVSENIEQKPAQEVGSGVGNKKEVSSEREVTINKTVKLKDGTEVKLKYMLTNEPDNTVAYILGFDKNNNQISTVMIEKGRDGKWKGNDLSVEKKYRRKGLATAMYDFADSEGHNLTPTNSLQPDGKEFWKNRKGQVVGSGVGGDVESTAKALEEKYGIILDLTENKNGDLSIGRIIVPKENRGKGVGKKAMQDIVDYADNNDRRILLTPSIDFGATSVARLKEFYKEFGFIENKGKNKDFTTKDSMYRNPQLTQEVTPAQQVEQLRAEEQSELNDAIPNADQYLTDGKVDRAKITDAKDLKKFDKIYDKYDKLITPLLPKKEAKAEEVERTEFDNEEDAELYDISRETDPNVIADKYYRLPSLENTDYKGYQLAQAILGKRPYKVSLKEWTEYGGDKSQDDLKKYKRFIKEGKGDIDDVTGILTERFGVEVTPEDIVETIINYGNKSEFNRKGVSNVEQALLERYFDLTGKRNITEAAAKKGFDAVNKKNKASNKLYVQKEALQEAGITEEDIAKEQEFASEGFGELETPLEKFEYQKKQISKKGKTKIEIAREIRLKAKAAVDEDRKRFGIAFDPENRAKVLFNYHKALVGEALAYIGEGINNVKDFAREIGEDIENIPKAVRDAWNEAYKGIKKREKDFLVIAEEEEKQIEKERLRREDLGLVTPKLEDYESEEPISTSKDFESLAYQAIESDEFRDTLSNKERESGKTLTRAEKRYQVNPLMAAFELGESIVAKAKEEFGDTYVNDLLAYIAKNQNTLGVDKSSLILLTLENDLNRQQLSDPNNITLAKQERMVQNLAIAYQRSAARAVGYGRLRQIARVGYDVDEVTNQLFSSEQVEGRRKVVKAMESTADEINDEAELQEQETEGELIIEEPKVKRDAKQVRADIKEVIKQMRADLVKSARGAGGALSAIPFAQQVKDVTPHIIKLSKLFAELGGMKTKDIVAKIRKSIKGLAPDVDETVITDILKGEKTTPKKAPKDRLEQTKDAVKARIEELKQEIEDKRKELKVVNKVKSDAELDLLLEQEKELKKIANQYLTQESIDKINESKEKSIVTKLENEIANIDEQIANQQKLPKSSSSPVTSLEITLLKAQRKARIDVLNELDPNPKAFTKQALIDAGYSREITVTTKQGKEKRQVLDWKKLAGNEMDVNAIKNIVEQALKDKGFTPAQISRMQDAFVNEFTELRASVIDKSLNTLRQMNEPKKPSERKSSARQLAELFDFGLFNQDPDKFNYLLNKILGLSDLDQESFFELNKLSEAIKEINLMNSNEFFTRQFIREINLKITKVLNKVARQQGSTSFKVVSVVAELMNLALRTKLLSLKQFLDNQISGRQERFIQDIGLFGKKAIDTKELKKLRLKYSSVIKSDITKNAGLYFGEVNSPFLTKSQIENYINSRTDNQIYHALVSIALGKSYLEGADSLNKAASTEKFFISMLLKVLTDNSNPNRMTPEAALQFVNEQLTGQKFADALVESAKIINQINTKAGRVILAETKQNIFRGAMDLVKANLLVGQALDANALESAYEAAYKIAGYGLGHEANNPISWFVNKNQAALEEEIKLAIKEKEWGKASVLTIGSTLNRNILNPFVGGGMNWLFLGFQKSGIDPFSPLFYAWKKLKNGIDMSTETGRKKLEETLIDDYRLKTLNRRLIVGGISASLFTLAVFASGGDDEMEEWLKKNEWARRYQSVFVPQLTLIAMAYYQGTLGDWLTETFSKSQKFERLPKIKKAIEAYNKGDSPEADRAKFMGVMGNVTGSFVDVPLLPVKFARDLGGVYRYIVDKPQEKPDFKNVGFANGFFNYGLIDYMGFRPDRTYMKNMEEYIPESDEKTIKFLRKNDLDINSNSDKAVLSNGIKKSLTEDEAQKYDNIWGKEAYRVIKEALVDNDDMDETQIKSLKKVAEFTATRKAQSELDVDNSSLQELEMDGVKYSLTESQINKRKALIKEYIRDNRNSEKFKDRYREAIKKGNIVGSAESKYFMLMESAKSSATRKMNDIYENKTSALEVIPK